MFLVEFDPETVAQLDRLQNTFYIMHIEMVMSRFYRDAGDICIRHIQDVLGHDDLYQLNAEYQRKKLENPFLYRPPGKDPDEPLILTGGLYNSLVAYPTSEGVTIGIASTTVYKGLARGFMAAQSTTTFLSNRIQGKVGRRYKPGKRGTNASYVADYAEKWQSETDFIGKGIEKAEPELVAHLGNLMLGAIHGMLGVPAGEEGEITGVSLEGLSQRLGAEFSE